MNTVVDVLVIGAGPAGLSAAIQLGKEKVSTLVVDEYPLAGGRLLGQLYRMGSSWWNGRNIVQQLMDEVGTHHSVALSLGTSVIGLDFRDEEWVAVLSGDRGSVRSRAVLIATGATEVPVPVKNWTMPGVMTIGAAQVMANVHGVRPGNRGMIIGGGPLAFAIAQELHWAEIDVCGIVMPNPGLPGLGQHSVHDQWQEMRELGHLAPRWLKPMLPLMNNDRWLHQMMAWTPSSGMRVSGTKLRPNIAAMAIEGAEYVTGVRLQRLNREGQVQGNSWVEEVDFVCLSGGLRPIADLFQAVGVAMRNSVGGLFDVPIFGPYGETTRPGIFGAGNALGVEGARVAMAQGQCAAVGILRYITGQSHGWSSEADTFRQAIVTARREAPLVFSPKWARIHQEIEHAWQVRNTEGTVDASQ